ncbi:flagellar hook-associated protein FlgL [Oceanirhabdus seepicola]|uniref:Flagellar hook-associated protein FlgL n=1 Tax=Oceanirhabdus seepicola TaxID=2828781 RepID=A0A9J6NVZ1_9CLOT|nr:flagellar hook-associated protein FlgL [Oceanirhabdus seepicola]MCM1988113.1 flagellar hook-associated protein FlgL [Oceanirhabdus seepicola]
MRVTNKMMSNNFLRDMNYNLKNMQRLQTQLTTGKEFKKPSDDPFKVARSMQLYSDIGANKQYNENVKDTINWLDTTDTATGQANNVFQRVHELMISAGNGGYSDNERRAIKDEINERISEFSQILNTSFDGKFIFGGSRGTVKPTDVTGGIQYKNAPVIKVDKISEWQGKKLSVKVAGGASVEVDIPADIKSVHDIANKINDELEKHNITELEVKSDFNEKSLTFIANKDKINAVSVTAVSPDVILDIKGKLDPVDKADKIDSGNIQLEYYSNENDEVTDAERKMIGDKLNIEISTGVTVGYNVTASEILEFKNSEGESKNAIDILNSLVNHLDGKTADGAEAGSIDSIKELLNGDLKDVKDILENLTKLRSRVGAMQNRMEGAQVRNEEENFNIKEILSKTEDIDIAEKTMEYATMQTVYLASLQTSAKVIQPSLLDYLR